MGRNFTTIAAAALALSSLATGAIGCGNSTASSSDGKADDPNEPLPSKTPRRIIWLIGDGMGLAQVTAGAYADSDPLSMLGMRRFGLVRTHEHEYVTTDSAASATAMASGTKTHFEGVGVVPGTTGDNETVEDNHLETVIDVAERIGWRTGIVATTSVVDATPGAFVAHRADRHSKDGIAEDLRHSGVDVILGGGSKFFEQRSDGQNLTNQLKSDGYSVTRTRTGLKRVAGKKTRVLGLFADKDMPEVTSGDRVVPLSEMTERAISILDRDNDDGFFLMVEGSWIDRKSHDVDGPGTIAEVIDFDSAVEVALSYARGRDDTLVIVTADHETGGLSILDPESAQPYISALGGEAAAEQMAAFPNGSAPPPMSHTDLGATTIGPSDAVDPRLVTSYGDLSVASRPFFAGPSFVFKATHSSTMVPLFAEGPADRFVTAARDNANLGIRVKRLVDANGVGGPAQPPPAVPPQNVVVVLADGAGLSSLTAASYVAGEIATVSMPVVGLSATHSVDRLVPDSAAAVSAVSLGAPTRNGAVGVDATGSASQPLLTLAATAGRATGLVTTEPVVSPDIAGLYATGAGNIEHQLVTSGLDVVFGGGRNDVSAGGRAAWEANGGVVDEVWSTTVPTLPVARLVSDGALSPASQRLAPGGDEPSLAVMTEVALDALSGQTDPFLLVIHTSGVSRAAAEFERTEGLIDEVTDLDRAVAKALEFARDRRDTVVVVVSLRDTTLSVIDNHYGFHKRHCGVATRCGGNETLLDLPVAVGSVPRGDGLDDVTLQGDFSPISVLLQYAWLPFRGHLANDVAGTASATFAPVFGFGPGADSVEGFRTLSDLGLIIRGWATGP